MQQSIVITMEGGVITDVLPLQEYAGIWNNIHAKPSALLKQGDLKNEWRNKHKWKEHKNFIIYLVDYDEENQ